MKWRTTKFARLVTYHPVVANTPFPVVLWRTAVLGRCPECGQSSMFSGLLETHERCAHCNLRYQTSPGAWLGAVALGYGIGAIVAVVLAFIEVMYRPMRELGLHPAWTIVVLALLATLIGYRWAKSTWFALLYQWNFMAFGDEPPGPPPTNPGRGSSPIEPSSRPR